MKYEAIIVIQARFNSRRLPGKAFLPLKGMPMFVYLIRRLKSFNFPYPIIIATTDRAEDDLIASWSQGEGVKVIRGEENDVIARFIRCLKAFPSDIVVRVTADNPLTDPNLINAVIDEMKKGQYNYVSALRQYPIGIGVDAFSRDLLMLSFDKAATPLEREHVNAYVLNHLNEHKTKDLPAAKELRYPDLNFSVDVIDDYNNVREIIESNNSDLFIKTEDAIKQACKRNIQRAVSS